MKNILLNISLVAVALGFTQDLRASDRAPLREISKYEIVTYYEGDKLLVFVRGKNRSWNSNSQNPSPKDLEFKFMSADKMIYKNIVLENIQSYADPFGYTYSYSAKVGDVEKTMPYLGLMFGDKYYQIVSVFKDLASFIQAR